MPCLVASLCLVTVLGAPPPAPIITGGAWMFGADDHPRLLGPAIHLRALAQAKPEAYDEIRRHAADNVMAAGIVAAVEGLDDAVARRYIDAALRNIDRGVTNIHQDTWLWLTESSLAFDLLYFAWTPAERQRLIEWMNPHLEVFTTDEGAFHNSTLSKILCYLRIAYATWGENPRANDFRTYALGKLYEQGVLPALLEFGEGGGYTECGWYTRGSLWHLAQALELARRVEGYDGFALAADFFYDRLAYEMLQPYPGIWEAGYGAERFPLEGDGALTYGGHAEYPRHTRTLLAQYYRGSDRSRAIANLQRRGSNFEARLVDFLYEEESDGPADLPDVPLSHYAAGIGKVYARSSWDDDATWLRFECGDLWNHHQHLETGNLEIFRNEPLATESGEYDEYGNSHSVNWLLRTIAHNCILVHMQGETWSQLRDGGRNAYANDGGQTKKWEWTVGSVEEWLQRREQFERGTMLAFEDSGTYVYMAGDCTASYVPEKLELWTREVVFLRPHTVIVLDRVRARDPSYTKTWLLHCRNEPRVTDREVTIADGDGRLVSRTLLPEQATLEAIYGYTYGGQDFSPPDNVQTPLAARWRIEVRPETPATEDLFLHVMFTDGPVATELLRDGDRVGVRVGPTEVWFGQHAGEGLEVQ